MENAGNNSFNLNARSMHTFVYCFMFQRLYPINYLRNVALKNTHTPYSIFIDVDLIPRKNLYEYLKRYVANVTDSKDVSDHAQNILSRAISTTKREFFNYYKIKYPK